MAEPLSYEEYKDAKALLGQPGAGLTPEELQTLQAGVDEYDARFIGGQAGTGAAPAGDTSPLTGVIDAQGNAYARDGSVTTPAALAAPSGPQVSDLNPDQPLYPQVLSLESPVAGPPARDVDPKEWLYKPEAQGEGSTVIFHEPPLDHVKRRLMENPQIIKTWLPNLAQFYTPDRVANLQKSDLLYQVVADDDWKLAKKEADEKGVAAYRYSKNPWLQGEHGLSLLDSAGLAVRGAALPAARAVTSLVLGIDSIGNFGIGGKALDAAGAKEWNETAVEEYPEPNRVGQVGGLFAPALPANRLYDFVASGGRALAPGAGVIGRTAISGAAGAVAGGVTQAAEEGVNQGYAMLSGERADNPIDVMRRIGGVSALSGAFGAGGELFGSFLGHAGERLAEGSAYRGIPDRLQRGGAEFDLMEGVKLDPRNQEVIERAKQLDVSPQDVMARDLAPELLQAAKQDLDRALGIVEENQKAFFASPEGRQALPATNTISAALDVVRMKHGPDEAGRITPNAPSALRNKGLELLNDQIGGVSLQPIEGAIALPASEAVAYLSKPHLLEVGKGLRSLGKNKGTRTAPPQPFGEVAPGGVEVRPAVDRELLPEHGPARDAQPGIGPDKPIPDQPFNDTRGELATQRPVEGSEPRELLGQHGPPRDAEPGMGLEGRPVPEQPFNDTRGELATDRPIVPDAVKGVAGAAAVGYAATSDDEGTQYLSAAGAGLLPLLKKRGIDTVYLVPKRHDAAHHEQTIRDIKGFKDGFRGKPPRELVKLDQAARRDRDARAAGGQEGGWSKLQDEHEKLIDDAQTVNRHLTQGGPDAAHQALIGYSKKQDGDLPRKEAIERAGESAGRGPDLQRLRLLDPLLTLRDAASPLGSSGVSGQRQGLGGIISRVVDPLAIRAMPAVTRAGAPDNMMRGGRAGGAARIGEDEQSGGVPPELRGLNVTDPRVQAWLKSRRANP